MTQSMQEVINPGDVVITIKSIKGMNFKKGDIIAFGKGNSKTVFIKRIYAVSGDTLQILRDHIRNREHRIPHDSIFEMMVTESEHPDSIGYFSSLTYQKHLMKSSSFTLSQKVIDNPLSEKKKLLVPDGHYFLVGDNYYESMDSRFWGFIPRENIKGKVICIF